MASAKTLGDTDVLICFASGVDGDDLVRKSTGRARSGWGLVRKGSRKREQRRTMSWTLERLGWKYSGDAR